MMIDQLRAANRDEMSGGRYPIFPFVLEDVPPIVVFRILRERFGKPNAAGDPPGILWVWALVSENGVLTVHDWRGGWTIGFMGAGEPDPRLVEDATKLREDIRTLSTRTRAPTGARVGGVITSPFHIFLLTAENLLDEARRLRKKVDTRQRRPSQEKEGGGDSRAAIADELVAKVIDYADFMVGTTDRIRSLLIASMFAHIVSLEGFLNVVYHLFTKPELADDQVRRIIERQPLDLKLRLVDTYCYCFETAPIDRHSELYKAALYLVSIRTNFAHAKLTPAMDEAVVEEERYPFLVTTNEAPIKYGISSDPLALDEDMVEKAGRIVWAIARQIIRSMKPDLGHAFAISMIYRQLQYRRGEDGKVSILLDPDDARHAGDSLDEVLGGEGEWEDWQAQ